MYIWVCLWAKQANWLSFICLASDVFLVWVSRVEWVCWILAIVDFLCFLVLYYSPIKFLQISNETLKMTTPILESLEFSENHSNFGNSFASISELDENSNSNLVAPLNIASHWNSADYRANVQVTTLKFFH